MDTKKATALGCVMAMAYLASTGLHAGEKRYYYTDPNGNVLAEADAQGNIVARYDYKPYGSPVPGTGPVPNGPGYTGHVHDAESGLIYMQARYYDPDLGRFLSVDPDTPDAANVFNFNRYAYVNNNPIMGIDPTGRVIVIVGDAAFTRRMNADLAKISEGAGGRALVSKLQATPNIIYLMPQTPGERNSTQADPSGISVNGKGTGSNVRINLELTSGGVDAKGNRTRPGYIALAHELGHARAMDQGVQSYDKGDKTPGSTPPSETHSMANENMVRQEHGLPIRPSYYDPLPSPPPPRNDQIPTVPRENP